jgi:hypothetical protein
MWCWGLSWSPWCIYETSIKWENSSRTFRGLTRGTRIREGQPGEEAVKGSKAVKHSAQHQSRWDKISDEPGTSHLVIFSAIPNLGRSCYSGTFSCAGRTRMQWRKWCGVLWVKPHMPGVDRQPVLNFRLNTFHWPEMIWFQPYKYCSQHITHGSRKISSGCGLKLVRFRSSRLVLRFDLVNKIRIPEIGMVLITLEGTRDWGAWGRILWVPTGFSFIDIKTKCTMVQRIGNSSSTRIHTDEGDIVLPGRWQSKRESVQARRWI